MPDPDRDPGLPTDAAPESRGIAAGASLSLDRPTALQQIASRAPYLHVALRRVAEFILEQPAVAKTMTITELAAACRVAESTVSRFVRETGFDRYQELRLGIAEALLADGVDRAQTDQGHVYGGISRNDDGAAIIAKITRSSHEALRQTGTGLDPVAIGRAVDLLDAAEFIAFCCMGSSSIAAEEGVMRFMRAGKKCLLFRDQSLQLMMGTIAASSDLLIGISASGESTPVVEALRRGRARGARTIGITSVPGSSLTRHADVALFTTSAGSPDVGLYGEAVTAKWGQILVIDVLYATFAVRHFDETLGHLERTYSVAIKEFRSSSEPAPTGPD